MIHAETIPLTGPALPGVLFGALALVVILIALLGGGKR